MTCYDNSGQLPVPEMSAAQLARYHQVLVSSLRRCREEHPRYRQMRACLADVLAGERARRMAVVPAETRCWWLVSACE